MEGEIKTTFYELSVPRKPFFVLMSVIFFLYSLGLSKALYAGSLLSWLKRYAQMQPTQKRGCCFAPKIWSWVRHTCTVNLKEEARRCSAWFPSKALVTIITYSYHNLILIFTKYNILSYITFQQRNTHKNTSSYSMGFFSEDEAAGAWRWLFFSLNCRCLYMELRLKSP